VLVIQQFLRDDLGFSLTDLTGNDQRVERLIELRLGDTVPRRLGIATDDRLLLSV